MVRRTEVGQQSQMLLVAIANSKANKARAYWPLVMQLVARS